MKQHEPRNIILLTVDALRADHLSCQGYERETTPNIDKIASENIQFTKAFSASSHTREAIPSLLTGKFPDTAVTEDYRLKADTIAAQLQQHGYVTGGFHSNPFTSRAFGFGDGFDTLDDDLYFGQNRIIALAQRAFDKLRNRHYARGEEINNRSLEWIDSLDESPFFLWNHYMDPHGPYEPLNEYRELFHESDVADSDAQKLYKKAINSPEKISDSEQKLLVDLYDSEIRYLDDQIESIFDSLRERNLIEESIIVITADHGDLFGEYGYYEHPRYPYRELLHVPLIIIHPDEYEATYSDPVSTLDIVPTVFDEIDREFSETDGISLRDRWNKPKECTAGHQFGQASTITDEGQLLRRYGIFTKHDNEILEFKIKGKSSEKTERFEILNPELGEILEEHAKERITIATNCDSTKLNKKEAGEVSEDIEDRLDALGYMER